MYFYDRASMQEHHQVGGGRRVVPMHSHPHEQVGIVLEGEFALVIGSERRDMKPGDMYIIPGGVPHQAMGSKKRALFFDVWSPPREKLLD